MTSQFLLKRIKDGHYQWVMPATQYDEINELAQGNQWGQ